MLDITLTGLIANAVALLLGFTFHEFSHAWVAYRLGDDTAKRQGRLTLNPLKHLDPFGAIMALIMRFGWAKPTPVSPWRLRYGPRVGGALVAVAGPISNLIIAALAAIPWRLGHPEIVPPGVSVFLWQFGWDILGAIVILNLALFVFNLIPLAPLDGIAVLGGIVGEQGARALAPLQRYGSQILLGLLLLGLIVPQLNIIGAVLGPVVNFLLRILVGR